MSCLRVLVTAQARVQEDQQHVVRVEAKVCALRPYEDPRNSPPATRDRI
jgi:hypothetical protein